VAGEAHTSNDAQTELAKHAENRPPRGLYSAKEDRQPVRLAFSRILAVVAERMTDTRIYQQEISPRSLRNHTQPADANKARQPYQMQSTANCHQRTGQKIARTKTRARSLVGGPADVKNEVSRQARRGSFTIRPCDRDRPPSPPIPYKESSAVCWCEIAKDASRCREAMPFSCRYLKQQNNKHAADTVRETSVDPAWLAATMDDPKTTGPHPQDPTPPRALRHLLKYGNRSMDACYQLSTIKCYLKIESSLPTLSRWWQRKCARLFTARVK